MTTLHVLLPALSLLHVALAGNMYHVQAVVTSPALFFGPTAALNKAALADLVDGLIDTPEHLQQWSSLREMLRSTNGALHLRRWDSADA